MPHPYSYWKGRVLPRFISYTLFFNQVVDSEKGKIHPYPKVKGIASNSLGHYFAAFREQCRYWAQTPRKDDYNLSRVKDWDVIDFLYYGAQHAITYEEQILKQITERGKNIS